MEEKNKVEVVKRYVSCPVCGRILMRCFGECQIDITCSKCGRDNEVIVDFEKIIVLERRNGQEKSNRQVKVIVPKQKNSECKKAN